MTADQVRSPLRYPGGKQKALGKIFAQFPHEVKEYREPFVGGGSVFIAVRQRYPNASVWINDLNPDLVAFWRIAQTQLEELVETLREIRIKATDGRALWEQHREPLVGCDFKRAVRFFIINRISFSGTSDSGGYSESAFRNRFTDSSLERLARLSTVLQGVRITNLDYREITSEPTLSDGAFVFLDPPYWNATKSKLYGVKGDLHTSFDHMAFAAILERCPHRWLVTYDDSPLVRQHFAFAQLETWQLQYGMNNYRQEKAAIGHELFLRNYTLESKEIS